MPPLKETTKERAKLQVVATATAGMEVGSGGTAPYLPKVLDENLNHDVLEFDVHHCCHGVLLCPHEGRSKYHPHVGW